MKIASALALGFVVGNIAGAIATTVGIREYLAGRPSAPGYP